MKTYRLVNNITGWVVFAIAAFTYCSTIEPTASFWDCPEFITTAEKMEVGHPPGAPFFMLFGKFFTLFASDATQVAKMINIMSALLSAGCILFLFWSVTHLAKKLIGGKDGTMSVAQLVAVMASGVGGALIYTWSDTFWFSAVEGEVYAFSSFFTALVFWLILKWEDNADEPHSDKWLVLISYLVGLSIGVHLLNLLCIPAIVLVFYFKKSGSPNLKGALAVLAVSMVIVAAVLYGMVPGIMKVSGWFELFFVNSLGMPFDTGLYVYILILLGCLVWGLWKTHCKEIDTQAKIAFVVCTAILGIPFYGHGASSVIIGLIVLIVIAVLLFVKGQKVSARLLNTALLCMTLITVGYSSYAVIVIRSTANPPMDQDSPEDVFSLEEYLGREQYGDRPLFYGQTYASQPEVDENKMMYKVNEGAARYMRKEKHSEDEPDEYLEMGGKIEYVYPSNQSMLFPRIYSSAHESQYKRWLGEVSTTRVPYKYNANQYVDIPTFGENIRFFISYQVNFMYWRYFLWNFAGRQNDIQSMGELEHGNWITGFSFIDDALYGDQDKLPDDLKNNKGHNVFYCLPLLLGLLGFFWQAFKGKEGIQQFWVVFFLFFMTGLAIVLYLNQTPNQPRERDYAYAGSFYAYAIWCGLGVAAVYDFLKRWLRGREIIAASIAAVPAIVVPAQMVSQTWDDHDRSGRYICRDFGLNYLETIPHDGVIFTNGDNDTFPLWYNEDTEGNRTDVRVCNLSYLQTDWYIDQMKRPAYEGDGASSPLPISWKRYEYVTGQNESVEVNPVVGQDEEGRQMKMSDIIEQAYEDDPEMSTKIWGKEPFELNNAIQKFVLKNVAPEYKDYVEKLPSCLPNDHLYVNVDKEAVRKSGMQLIADSIPDRMEIDLSGRSQVYKNFMMMLEMIGQSNFSRPLYMSTTVGPDNYGNLYKHFIQEGIAWRFTPYTYSENQAQRTVVDTEKMYDNMMNKYKYGNLKQEGLYIDETTLRMCNTHRRWFALLIKSLVAEGKTDKALKALKKCEEEIPAYNVPHEAYSGSMEMAQAYMDLGKVGDAERILKALTTRSLQYVDWYMSLSDSRFRSYANEADTEIFILDNLLNIYAGKLNDDKYCAALSASDLKTLKESSKALNKAVFDRYNQLLKRCADNQISFLTLQYPSQGTLNMVEAFLRSGNVDDANANSASLAVLAGQNLDAFLAADNEYFKELSRKGLVESELAVLQTLVNTYDAAASDSLGTVLSPAAKEKAANGKASVEEMFGKYYKRYYERMSQSLSSDSEPTSLTGQ